MRLLEPQVKVPKINAFAQFLHTFCIWVCVFFACWFFVCTFFCILFLQLSCTHAKKYAKKNAKNMQYTLCFAYFLHVCRKVAKTYAKIRNKKLCKQCANEKPTCKKHAKPICKTDANNMQKIRLIIILGFLGCGSLIIS